MQMTSQNITNFFFKKNDNPVSIQTPANTQTASQGAVVPAIDSHTGVAAPKAATKRKSSAAEMCSKKRARLSSRSPTSAASATCSSSASAVIRSDPAAGNSPAQTSAAEDCSNTTISADASTTATVSCEAGSTTTVSAPATEVAGAASLGTDVSSKAGRHGISTFEKHPWCQRQEGGGYLCSICKEYGRQGSATSGGSWVTIPVDDHKRLYEKANKHAKSESHIFAAHRSAAATAARRVSTSVIAQLRQQACKESDDRAAARESIMRMEYFLLKSEIPHTLSLRYLVSAVASCSTGTQQLLAPIKTAPANAFHLSTYSSTTFLETFGELVKSRLRERFARVQLFALLADEATDINMCSRLSVCIRFHDEHEIQEHFLACIPLESTDASSISDGIKQVLADYKLNMTKCAAVSFDGAANFSGVHGGVQAILRESQPTLLYVHCSAHRLQLALMHASSQCAPIKRLLASVGRLYSQIGHSPKRIRDLLEIEKMLEEPAHKLVQPVATRWLSYDRSISMIWQHYAALLLLLEDLYTNGELGGEVGGLLLEMRRSETIYFTCILKEMFCHLSRLSRCLQSASITFMDALKSVNATLDTLLQIDFDRLELEAAAKAESCTQAGVHVEHVTVEQKNKILSDCKKYLRLVVQGIRARFSDDFSCIARFQQSLHDREVSPDFTELGQLFNMNVELLKQEWPVLRNYPGDFSQTNQLSKLASEETFRTLLPNLSQLAQLLLLVPIGTATVERTFSAMNRIMTDLRSRLSSEHLDSLLLISIEGPEIPDIRDATVEERSKFDDFIHRAYLNWLQSARRL